MIKLQLVARTQGMSPGEAAAHWVVRKDRDDIGPREEAQFTAWLEQPANAAAFARAQNAFNVFEADIDTDRHLQAMRQAALATVPSGRYRASTMVAASLAGLGIAAALTFGSLDRIWPGRGPAVTPQTIASSDAPAAYSGSPKRAVASVFYTTGIGERRTIRLQDGSSVVLNTRSQIAVAYAPERRLIRLVRGQALFDVAHNAARPFSVDAAGRRTTALGTLFQVRVDLGRLQVVLARGRVSIENQGGTGRRKAAIAYLNPGQAFLASRGAVPRIMRVDVERELRWRDGFVEFDDVTLASAVAEINRYAVRPIRLSDDGVGRLHVSGVFRTGDAKHFVDTVDALLPVQVSETGPGELKLSLTPVPPRVLP